MKELIKNDLYRAFRSKMFFISALVSSVFAVGSFVQRYMYESNYFRFANLTTENPSYEIDTLFNQWIGAEGGSSFYFVFYLFLPVFASLPYSVSYLEEAKSGYLRLMTVKGKKGEYLTAKYFSVFISGAAVLLIAVLLNIALCATYFPVITPDVYYDAYYGIGLNNAFGALFYSAPAVYLFIYVILTALYGGLFAVVSMVCSYIVKNKYIAVFIPFFLCLILTYITPLLRLKFHISPTSFLHPGAVTGAMTNAAIIFGELIFGILLTFALTVFRGKNNDIF